MNPRPSSLYDGFLSSCEQFPEQVALEVGGWRMNYSDLAALAARIAHVIRAQESDPSPVAAVIARRSVTAFAGLLGILASGKAYVPMHPAMPAERNRQMLKSSGANVIVAGRESLPGLPDLLCSIPEPKVILGPEIEDFGELPLLLPQHRFVSASEIGSASGKVNPPRSAPDDLAYLLFTSGTTGVPKGVPISHGNAVQFVACVCDRYHPSPGDRVAQTAELTFDLSVLPMYLAWWGGACLCCVPDSDLVAPAKFIFDREITVWCSVPSIALGLANLHLLKPNTFPLLRLSLFCGEALPSRVASLWQSAAPASRLENLYGPTEATVAVSAFEWQQGISEARCRAGIVPLGWSFPHQKQLVVKEGGGVCGSDEPGELFLGGPQVASGYWKEPWQTAESFVRLAAAPDEIWYRTGDIVESDSDGCLYFRCRSDSQVKIRGHRVELSEVEAQLRRAGPADLVAAVAWPFREGLAQGIVGFVGGKAAITEGQFLSSCRRELPGYMVPSRVVLLRELPMNPNGKIDRRALTALLDSGQQN